MNAFDELYQDIIMDHYRSPRGRASLPHVPEDRAIVNPSCGDSIKLELELDAEGRIAALRHDGHGCAISTASASLMTESLRGRSPDEARALALRFIKDLRGDGEPGDLETLGDLAALSGVAKLPARVKCATLAWHAALNALEGA